MEETFNELSTEHWERVLREARKWAPCSWLSGGEPLLRKDLEHLVAYARTLGFYTNLITSGIGMTENVLPNSKKPALTTFS